MNRAETRSLHGRSRLGVMRGQDFNEQPVGFGFSRNGCDELSNESLCAIASGLKGQVVFCASRKIRIRLTGFLP